MRLIKVNAPQGAGAQVAQIAFAVGIAAGLANIDHVGRRGLIGLAAATAQIRACVVEHKFPI